MGVSWTKVESPTLTRINKSVGKVANVGVDSQVVVNDFDTMPIFKDIKTFVDPMGNVFRRIPKFYISKEDVNNYKTWRVSKIKMRNSYLPECFRDQATGKELAFFDVGRYMGSMVGTKLQSVSGAYPLVGKNIVEFRTAAQANNVGGLSGYQQLDIHTIDMLQTLFYVEFATLNSQSIMAGYTVGQYSASHVAIKTENAVNRIVLENAFAALFEVDQAIGIGTSLGGNQIASNRTITAKNALTGDDTAYTEILFDGAAVNIAAGNIVYNTGYKNGATDNLAASSGSHISNTSGKHSMSWLGLENLFGNVWQFVDGVNINDRQAWVCKNAADYASNVFASPYEQLSYVNGATDGYVSAMGFDSTHPCAALPASVAGGESNKYYANYYYQITGMRMALFGGSWGTSARAGLSSWHLYSGASVSSVLFGGRLCRKAQVGEF